MNTTITSRRRMLASLALATGTLLGLSACAGAAAGDPAAGTAPGGTGDAAALIGPRVALTYDGGLLVLDGTSLETLADIELAGFNRVNPAGDGRSVMVSTTEGFQVLDTGAGSADAPELTDLVFEASAPGHVVRHDGRTVLFADGTGDTTIVDSADLLAGAAAGRLPETETVPSPQAHHGVSIELADGTLLTTIGTPDARTGVRALDADRTETARNEECPSVHGEGAVRGEIAVFGCSDGVLLYDDGVFTKLTAPDAYGRTGNAYVTDTSPIMVGDYNADPDAEGYVLSALTIVDAETKTSRVVSMPEGVGYTWRDVARSSDDGAVVLGTDGALHLLDVTTGEFGASFPVIEAWQGPAEWQDAHPALVVDGDTAYVTDPATSSIHSVDVRTGELLATGELGAVPNEIAVVG
ncbi:zinc metallochaperone AztD [Herbiconiux sp. CPCC 205716]|uniref:Zinc metallochaperone AztD n=1 Tax=Herbiconiux gentiana TaxID=2970912 RepID=A0ABT2GKB4_9MICO|nr:zinc metallochaperone AztD [Herbiconiux gentiana]MCS5715740.1 zinc metallochaperone AztD [Herbiconiux gentiana]